MIPLVKCNHAYRWVIIGAVGLVGFSNALSQDVGTTSKRVVEIQKAGRDITNPYLVTLSSDRTVSFSSHFRTGYWQKRSHLLSEREYSRVLALLREERFAKFAATPPDPVLLPGGIFAYIKFFKNAVHERMMVDDRNDSHMGLFNELVRLLRVEDLRCPFIVKLDEKMQDLCAVEKELQQRLEDRNRK